MTQAAVYVGTFDPITKGHLDLIERARCLFARVIVGVAKSERKTPMFSLEKRLALVEAAVAPIADVTVASFSGLTIDFAKEYQAHYLVRGLRSSKDYEYECEIAEMNRQMAGGKLETVFLPAKPELSFISSSIVRELILIKAFDRVAEFVPFDANLM